MIYNGYDIYIYTMAMIYIYIYIYICFHINFFHISHKSNIDIIIHTPGKCSMNGNAMNGIARKTYRNMPSVWTLAPSVPSSIVMNIVTLVTIGII